MSVPGRITNLAPIPVGDWTLHIVYAEPVADGEVYWEYSTLPLVGWGYDRAGKIVPVVCTGDRLLTATEAASDDKRQEAASAWEVLPRGEEPDMHTLADKAHQRVLRARGLSAEAMQTELEKARRERGTR